MNTVRLILTVAYGFALATALTFSCVFLIRDCPQKGQWSDCLVISNEVKLIWGILTASCVTGLAFTIFLFVVKKRIPMGRRVSDRYGDYYTGSRDTVDCVNCWLLPVWIIAPAIPALVLIGFAAAHRYLNFGASIAVTVFLVIASVINVGWIWFPYGDLRSTAPLTIVATALTDEKTFVATTVATVEEQMVLIQK